jgi:hypothetical protein
MPEPRLQDGRYCDLDMVPWFIESGDIVSCDIPLLGVAAGPIVLWLMLSPVVLAGPIESECPILELEDIELWLMPLFDISDVADWAKAGIAKQDASNTAPAIAGKRLNIGILPRKVTDMMAVCIVLSLIRGGVPKSYSRAGFIFDGLTFLVVNFAFEAQGQPYLVNQLDELPGFWTILQEQALKKTKFAEAQIAFIVNQAAERTAVGEVCHTNAQRIRVPPDT